MNSSERSFRNALGNFATGVCVVTIKISDQKCFGMTINSFSSVSLDPPMVLWSLSKSSNYFDAVMSSDRYVINILSENNKPLSKKFSGKDRILESEHTDISQPQFPKIIDAIAHFNCEVSHRYEGGDHIIILGTVVDFKSLPSDEPLIFYAGEYRSINARQSNQ